MAVEVAAVVEGLLADGALKGAGPRVDPRVDHQVLPAAEQLPTETTNLEEGKTLAVLSTYR